MAVDLLGLPFEAASRVADCAGEFNTVVPNWFGDMFKFRIWNMMPVDAVEDSLHNPFWMVEPV